MRGIAIRTTIGRLKKSLSKTLEQVYLGEVAYGKIDDTNMNPDGNGFTILCMKRLEFSSERELRAIVWSHGMLDGPCEEQEWNPNADHIGLKIRVVVDDLIDSVVLSPGASLDFGETVASLLDTYGIGRNVLHRSVVDDSHSLAEANAELTRVKELTRSFDTLASWAQKTLMDYDGESLANVLMACKLYALTLELDCGSERERTLQEYRQAIRHQLDKLGSTSRLPSPSGDL